MRGACDVPAAHDAVPVGDGEVQQTARVGIFSPLHGDLGDELVDPLDGVQHRFPEHGMPKSAIRGVGAGIMSGFLHAVEKQGKGPFAIGPPLDAVEPFGVNGQGEGALDVLPAFNVPVVHPHQASVAERMAVAVRERSLGRGAQMGKDQGGRGFARQSFQIDAIPGGHGGGEDARLRAEGWRCVVANTETIAIMRSSHVLGPRSELIGSSRRNIRSPRESIPAGGDSRMIVSGWNVGVEGSALIAKSRLCPCTPAAASTRSVK